MTGTVLKELTLLLWVGGGSGRHLHEKQNALDAEFQVAKRNGLHEGVRGTNGPWYLLLWAPLWLSW